MFPVLKVFTLTVKMFTRPILARLKTNIKSEGNLKNQIIARQFIRLGILEYRMSMWVNRMLFKIETDSDMFYKPLKNDVALENGLDLFFESAGYILIFFVCLFEIQKYAREGDASKKRNKKKLEELTNGILALEEENERLKYNMKLISMELERISLNLKISGNAVDKAIQTSELVINKNTVDKAVQTTDLN